MRRIFAAVTFGTLTICAAGAARAQMPPSPPAGNVLEQSSEYRFQLDLHVNDAALAKMLPAGWQSNAATTGPAKDVNLRLIFVDCVNIVGPDNKILGKGTNRLVMLAVPVKKTGGTDNGQMILGGISEDANVPDAFGVYLPSSSAKLTRSESTANGAVTAAEDWDFAAAGGEHLQLHLKYARGAGNKGGGETKFYNPVNPTQYQVSATVQVTDVTRNANINPPDRVQEFSFKAGGGKFAALFDGSEKPLSWDSQPVYTRTVSAP